MFFHLPLKKKVSVHPRFLGPNLQKHLKAKILEEVEGSCNSRYGYIVAVTEVKSIGTGFISEIHSGHAIFDVEYQAVVFKVFKGEVLDCVVTQVTKMGFFAEAGPLNVFVSTHLMPEEYEFSSGTDEPQFVSLDQTVRIVKNCEVRLRVVGTRADAQEIKCVGTIKDDYLGLIGEAEGI
mmetsp:Transcript_2935/g.10622  ORF Transcript_2935/g.10622 Transcript_2935/m.10622 type:complete len:179 (-) Transcript_2935:610-1146(-)